jgi:hypothetical protein
VLKITDALKGPVAEVFRQLNPAFGEMSGPEIYECVIGNSELLHGCVTIFRRKREAFGHLLVDAHGRPVHDDFVRLRCGRTLHDIIAMLVRTHAKRHFGATLGGDPNDARSKAGRLYHAINDYLIHEWQIPLVPHYSLVPPSKVLELGPVLLDIRQAADLDAISAAGSPPPPNIKAEPVLFVPRGAGPQRAEPAFTGTKQEEFWWDALTDAGVVAVLGQRNGHESRELVAAMAGVNDATRGDLFAGLSLSTFQAAVLLATAYRVLGRNGFTALFGTPGKPAAIATIATRIKQHKTGSLADLKTLAKMTEAVVRL